MELKNLTLTILLLSATASHTVAAAADTDILKRGYYDRPYLRYEAEPGKCSGSYMGLDVPVPYSQKPLQAEASNMMAVTLVSKGDNVTWVCSADADAMTLRFSIPDSPEGGGQQGRLALKVDGRKIADVELSSFWSWQYIPVASSSNKYPDKDASGNKFVRMRFDEKSMLLPETIKSGCTFSLEKEDDSAIEYTIDFVELEKAPAPVEFDDIQGDKVMYHGDGSTLQTFIDSNNGKIIYLPAGDYTLPRRIMINAANTGLVGAGSWYTNMYFSASSSNRRTYSARGIESYASNVRLEGFSMNSASNIRYYDNNEAYGIGKGLQGSFGRNSVVRDLRVEHFECGGWIGDYGGVASDGLRIEHCRFRNNYADGINLCSGTRNAVVTHCSFRNNGDDDMASWSTGNATENNEFSYCTAEHNWRASSLAFFGGKGNKAHHIHIADGMECGARFTADFQGTGFDGGYTTSVSDITIERCGTASGAPGVSGDLWGNRQPSMLIQAGYWYDINNLDIRRVEIYDTRNNGISVMTNSGKKINGLELHDILVSGMDGYGWGIYLQNTLTGSGHYSNLKFEGFEEPGMSTVPARFDFTDVTALGEVPADNQPQIQAVSGAIVISGAAPGTTVRVYDIAGKVLRAVSVTGESTVAVAPGIYIVAGDSLPPVKVAVRE